MDLAVYMKISLFFNAIAGRWNQVTCLNMLYAMQERWLINSYFNLEFY